MINMSIPSDVDYSKFVVAENSKMFSLLPGHGEQMIKFLSGANSKPSTIIDMNAHIGVDSVNFAKGFPDAQVISIEIDPAIHKLLLKNVVTFDSNHESRSIALNADCVEWIKNAKYYLNAVAYFDPPWHGTEYKHAKYMSLYLSGVLIQKVVAHTLYNVAETVLLKAPNNFDRNAFREYLYFAEITEHKIMKPKGGASYIVLVCRIDPARRGFVFAIAPTVGLSASFIRHDFVDKPGKPGKHGKHKHGPSSLDSVMTAGTPQTQRGQLKVNPAVVSRLARIYGLKDKDVAPVLDINRSDIYLAQLLRSLSKPHPIAQSRNNKRANVIASELKHLNVVPTKIIDIGAGDGGVAVELAKLYGNSNIVAADISDWAGVQNTNKDLNYITIKYDEVPADSDEFNVVTILQAMHHFVNLPAMLREVARICKSGGALIIREHNCANASIEDASHIEHMAYNYANDEMPDADFRREYYGHFRSLNEWIAVLATYGFEFRSYNQQRNSAGYFYASFVKK